MAKFKTQYDRKEDPGQEGGGELITEQAGYVPPQVQIENMIMAGQRLNASRAEMYDTMEVYEEPDIDPTRSPGFDLADASAMKQGLINKVKNNKNVQTKPAEEETVEENKDETPDK